MNPIDASILILLIMTAAGVSMYRSYRRRQFEEQLGDALRTGGYEAFRHMMESKDGRRFYPRYTAKLKLLDGAIALKQCRAAEQLIEELNHTNMSAKDYVNYNMTVLSYAAAQKDQDMAETARDALHKRGIASKYAQEADQVYDIYLLRKSNHIDELRAFAAKIKNPSSRAMAYYRIARQHYYLKDLEQCRKYLLLSKNVYKEKTWQALMQNMLDGDYSLLED